MITGATRLTFGKHKGSLLKDVPSDYLRWLADPITKNGHAKIPADIQTYAKAAIEAETKSESLLRGMPFEGASPLYVVERDGDITGNTCHGTLHEAMAQLAVEFPMRDNRRIAPDPEDDRILIWEVLPSGHRKVVAQFCGWHWSDKHEAAQIVLPGDARDLYDIANDDL